MTPQTTPIRLDLNRQTQLEIVWQDGRRCVYPLAYLRSMCPCATCKGVREEDTFDKSKKPLLRILPGNYAEPITATAARRVGNYAIAIDWSDDHGSGIYSYEYLREICPGDETTKSPAPTLAPGA